jgi:hypothetical protein
VRTLDLTLGRSTRRWEDNIKIDFLRKRVAGCGMDLSQNRDLLFPKVE